MPSKCKEFWEPTWDWLGLVADGRPGGPTVYSQVNVGIGPNARSGQGECWLETQLLRKFLIASDVSIMMSLPNPSYSR